jgi:hypothetical protein
MTPGPWEVYDQGKDDGGEYGCFVRSTTDPIADWIACDIQNRSDAHLIAAAPDLLAELKHLVRLLEPALSNGQANVPGLATINKAWAVIAKAEGR